MALLIRKYPGRLMTIALAALLGCAIIACNQKSSQPELADFTDDEKYLIDAYVQVKQAERYYPHQEAIADSIFDGLGSTIDTVRVARTIAQLNETPDRWVAVYEAIERQLREAQGRDLQRTRPRADASAEVE